MIPTTPSGTRTLRMRRPFDFVHSAKVSPMGSGRAATSRTPLAMSLTRDGVSRRRSRMAPSRPEFCTSSRFAARMLFVFVSIAWAIASSSAFFSSVESKASLADAARARSSFSWVAAAVVRVGGQGLVLRGFFFGGKQGQPGRRGAGPQQLFLGRSGGGESGGHGSCLPVFLWREISSDFAFHAQRDRLGMPPIHDGDVDSALARQFGGAQFGNHAAASLRTLAVALRLERGSELANHPLQARLLAAVGNQESIDVGQQQQPVGFDGRG